MKNRKTVWVLTILLGLFFTQQTVHAQCQERAGEKAAHMTMKLTEKLSLSDEQSKQLLEINTAFATEMSTVFQEEMGREEKHDRVKVLRDTRDEKIKSMLTEAQLTTFNEVLAHKKGHHRFGPPHHARKGHHKKGGDFMPHIPRKIMHNLEEVDRKALKTAVKEYAMKNIMPVVRAKRADLDKSIQSPDRRVVIDLRMQVEGLKEEGKALKEQKRASKESGDTNFEALKEEFEAFRTKKKAIGEQARPLVEKYDEVLTTALKELREDNHEQWRTDVKAIILPFAEKAGISKEDLERGGKGHHGGKGFGHHDRGGEKGDCEGKDKGKEACEGRKGDWKGGEKHRGHKGGHKKMKFLLMDPDAPSADFLLEDNKINRVEVEEAINVYPNPTIQLHNIAFKVRKDGNVQIDLLSRDGQFIKTVINENKTAGKYTEGVDLSGLEDEIYLYRITDAKGTRTKRFLKQN